MDNLYLTANAAIEEVKKAIVGKEDVVEIIMSSILAGGHVLIEDKPGVGKTTMALAFARVLGLEEKRVQFTPDVTPSDLIGFSMLDDRTGNFVYQPGAVMCNLLLADEINRTSPKTQSALLQVMEENSVTVDGNVISVEAPFIVIATQNPEGSAGTQLLPESQLDRFMISINMGYPTVEEEVEILKRRSKGKLTDNLAVITDAQTIIDMQKQVSGVYVDTVIYEYIANLAKETRESEYLVEGISSRGAISMAAMIKAKAWLKGRDYAIPEDIGEIFIPTVKHRVRLNSKAKVSKINIDDLISQIYDTVKRPTIKMK